MPDLLRFLLTYGYIVIFGAAFAEQIGLPLPAVPLLVGMGALCRSGEFSFALVIVIALIGSLAGDLIWYELGRHHGRSVLQLICRISLEPDYCVRRTEDSFERRGLWVLLLAKFVPGFNAAAVPLAGMMKTSLFRFLAFDVAGLIVWTSTYTLLGYVFSRQLERIVDYLSTLGISLVIVVVAGLAGYVGYKFGQRRKFLKTLSVRRITPEDLKDKMDANEKILILDMRNRLDRNTDPVRIPGAFHVLPEHVQFEPEDLGVNQEIVVYCT
jgi:membrane protein DedA with SNARE-associated domain